MSGAVETQRLGRRFKAVWALQDCTVQVGRGAVCGLVGPNGAGKTTLMLLAMGQLAVSTGTVRVLGMDPVRQQAELLPRIGFVAQGHPLYPRFLVSEMVELGRRLNPGRFSVGVARSRLGDAGVPLRRRVGALSGGEQAQVAVAIALAKRPDLLVLDEPVASLDPLARRHFLQVVMDAVAADGMSVLVSSHLISDLERVCDELILIAGGRVQLSGALSELVAQHHLYVGPGHGAGLVENASEVIQSRRSGRQASVLVRGDVTTLDPAWQCLPVAVEELVLAYMDRARQQAGPADRDVRTGAAS